LIFFLLIFFVEVYKFYVQAQQYIWYSVVFTIRTLWGPLLISWSVFVTLTNIIMYLNTFTGEVLLCHWYLYVCHFSVF